jgi:Recombinase
VRQTFQWFRDHDLELPANPIQGTRLIWKIPSQSLIRDILRNPFYAGAYVWGRRPVTTLLVGGRLEKRQSALRSAEECRVFIRDHHIGYIDWATYEENQRMMRRNSVNWEGDESMAAIRAGQGLLVALDYPQSFSYSSVAVCPFLRIACTRKGPVVQSTVSSERIRVLVSRTPEWGQCIAVVRVIPGSADAPAGHRVCRSRTVADMALLSKRSCSNARLQCDEPHGKG